MWRNASFLTANIPCLPHPIPLYFLVICPFYVLLAGGDVKDEKTATKLGRFG